MFGLQLVWGPREPNLGKGISRMTAAESAWLRLQPENLRKKPFETPSSAGRSFLLGSLRKRLSSWGWEGPQRSPWPDNTLPNAPDRWSFWLCLITFSDGELSLSGDNPFHYWATLISRLCSSLTSPLPQNVLMLLPLLWFHPANSHRTCFSSSWW